MSGLANKIEAILYLKAQPLKIAQIAEFAQCDRDSAEEGLIALMGQYAHREGALEIAETEDGYSLQLRELYKPLVDAVVPLDIGLGALRTLAAIALRGPIIQSELVDVRGSGVYQHVPDLVEQGFVKKRRDSDSRSSWLQVTEKFYQHFEIDKLPQIESLRLPKQKDLPLDADGSEENPEVESAEVEGPEVEGPEVATPEVVDSEIEDADVETSEMEDSDVSPSDVADSGIKEMSSDDSVNPIESTASAETSTPVDVNEPEALSGDVDAIASEDAE